MDDEELQALAKRLHVKIRKHYCVQEKDGLFYYKEKVMNESEFKCWIDTLPRPVDINMSHKEDEA